MTWWQYYMAQDMPPLWFVALFMLIVGASSLAIFVGMEAIVRWMHRRSK